LFGVFIDCLDVPSRTIALRFSILDYQADFALFVLESIFCGDLPQLQGTRGLATPKPERTCLAGKSGTLATPL